MRKFILAAIAALLLGSGLSIATAGSASAAADHRKCVTIGEYRAVTKNMRQTRVFDILDGRGSLLTQQWDSIDAGYWEEEYWVDTSYYDEETGEWIEDGYWDGGYWVENWVDVTDSVRSWKRCSGGYMTINFDNYSGGISRMHVYKKWGTGTNRWAVANWIDSLYSYDYRAQARGVHAGVPDKTDAPR